MIWRLAFTLAAVSYALAFPTNKIVNFDNNELLSGIDSSKIKAAQESYTVYEPFHVSREGEQYCCQNIRPAPGILINYRFKSNEFSSRDDSYKYVESSNSTLNKHSFNLLRQDYDSWAVHIKQEYPNLEQRLTIYKLALERYPSHQRLSVDYATLLSWNSKHQIAVSFYRSQLQSLELPVYGLNAIALSARELDDYQLSKDLYSRALAKDPQHVASLLGMAALEARHHNYVTAEEYTQKALPFTSDQSPEKAEALSLLAYIYNQQQGKSLNKIQAYEKLLELEPNRPKIIRLRTLSLLDIGLIDQAAEEMTARPDLYEDKDWLRLSSEKNTKAIRRITNGTNPSQQKALIQQALVFNNSYTQLLEGGKPVNQKALAVAYADRLLLLNKVNRYHDAISLAESNNELIELMPDYGLIALARSYHALEQPDKAVVLLEQSFKAGQIDSTNDKALGAAYYAALDTGDIDKAELFLQRLIERQAKWLYSADGQRRKLNPKYREVSLLKAMHKAFTNDLAGAEADVRLLLSVAPNNNEYRQNLADILRWRGFINQSNRELDIIQATDPEYKPSQISRIYNHLAHRRFDKAGAEQHQFSNLLDNRAKRLVEDYDIATDARFTVSMSGGDSDGSSFSSKDRNYEAKVFSPLIEHHWRFFGSSQNYNSDFLDQADSVTTQGIGAQYESRWFTSAAEVFSVNGFSGSELAVSHQFYLDDHLSFDLNFQTFNKNTPVRALTIDVTSDLSSASLNYRVDERQSYNLLWESSSFSDGNQRESLGLSGSQLVYQDYNQRLLLSESIYRTENSADANRFYFNPSSALTLSITAGYDELLYKNVKTSLWHGLVSEVGVYQQKGFERGDIWSVSYRHQWQLSKRSYLNYAMGYSQRVYDGQNEKGPTYSLTYGVSF